MNRKFLSKIKAKLLFLLSTNKFLTALYYLFNTNGFINEQFSVFSGIMKNRNDSKNIGNFRRNIHRIEKGLITQPSKPVFAENYIFNTVLTYHNLLNSNCDSKTLIWATGILKQYFETVEKTSVILKAFEKYQKTQCFDNEILPRTYSAITRVKSKISIDDFIQLNKQRRSIRYYQKKQVPRDLVDIAINVALQSPSACNRQPFSFRIIDDNELIKTAVKIPKGATTFSDNIPMIIFIIGDLSNYFDEIDKHIIYIDGALAAMNFILALEIQGISSCIINWSDISKNNKILKEFLKLEQWEQCVMSISIGYSLPEGGIPSSIKKDAKTITKYN